MKLGLVVNQLGLSQPATQAELLRGAGAEEILEIKPRTGEDWYYQTRALVDGNEELGIDPAPSGSQIYVQDLHYLGQNSLEIMQTIVDLTDAGMELICGGESLTENGILAAARALLQAEDERRRVKVAQLLDVARRRRNATPPKCILVPVELLPDDLARQLGAKAENK